MARLCAREGCGNEFEPSYRHPQQRFCSAGCRVAAYYADQHHRVRKNQQAKLRRKARALGASAELTTALLAEARRFLSPSGDLTQRGHR